MINQQIILWIVQNRRIYFIGENEDRSWERQGSIGQQQLKDKLQRINDQLKKRIPIVLNARKQATISSFITFFVQDQSKSQSAQVHYRLNDKLKMIITQHDSKMAQVEEAETDIVTKQVSSALMMEKQCVQTLLLAFSKAIHDLIANGHPLSLSFDFCLIKISKKQCRCIFRKAFLRSIKTKVTEKQRQNYKLYLYPALKCSNKPMYNITEQIRQTQQAKWKQIKLGNLYDRPSLQQIKNLYDRGSALELKYKQHFEN